MLSTSDLNRIQKIVRDAISETPVNLRLWKGNILFTTQAGETMTREACVALREAGLQHNPEDDSPEFYITGTDGASRADVRWPFDTALPTWNE